MGANSREDGVDLTQFGLPLAFILGIFGMLYHAYRDEKMAFSILSFVSENPALLIRCDISLKLSTIKHLYNSLYYKLSK